jgi:pimeloyl-ACP methyl ester carboxylesterase
MVKTKPKKPLDFIVPLDMNGLHGRMLRLTAPPRRKREILLVYGHHASLERVAGLAEVLNEYGAVTMPDLPGFGGMDSFYRLDQKPTLDNLADYLASFIKLRYRNSRFTLVGMSFGFVVATRMLQKYPDLAKKVDLLVSLVGFLHHDELVFSPARARFYRLLARVFARPLPSLFFRNIILHPSTIRAFYARTHNAKHKFAHLSQEQKVRMTEFEVYLWRCNDVRTYMVTAHTMLTLDICQARVNVPVWHLYTKEDNYFDNAVIEQHMQVVYSDCHLLPLELKSHSVTVIASKHDFADCLPRKLREKLAEKA